VKYGILADIHGNLEALQAVLPLLEHCDEILCAGDVVGYGPNPNECCALLRERNCATIEGNHDLASIGAYDLRWFNDHARAAIEWTAKQLTPENAAFLEANPQRLERETFSMAHGSLVSPVEQYLGSVWDVQSTFEAMEKDLCFVGHTHVAAVFSRGLFNRLGEREVFPAGGTVKLRRNRKYVINCGSLGQPRDRNPAGSFGLYDSDAGVVEILRVHYDVASTQKKMAAVGLPKLLITRLAHGT